MIMIITTSVRFIVSKATIGSIMSKRIMITSDHSSSNSTESASFLCSYDPLSSVKLLSPNEFAPYFPAVCFPSTCLDIFYFFFAMFAVSTLRHALL